jgi:hypothetical protein
MPEFSPTHASTHAIIPPSCPKCGTIMMLAPITPDGAGNRRTFECPSCDHSDSEVMQFN